MEVWRVQVPSEKVRVYTFTSMFLLLPFSYLHMGVPPASWSPGSFGWSVRMVMLFEPGRTGPSAEPGSISGGKGGEPSVPQRGCPFFKPGEPPRASRWAQLGTHLDAWQESGGSLWPMKYHCHIEWSFGMYPLE